jgi:hypothetical protein
MLDEAVLGSSPLYEATCNPSLICLQRDFLLSYAETVMHPASYQAMIALLYGYCMPAYAYGIIMRNAAVVKVRWSQGCLLTALSVLQHHLDSALRSASAE